MKKTKSKPSPKKKINSSKQAKLAALREEFQRLEFEELHQPSKPIQNEGESGAKLNKTVEQSRKQLQEQFDAAMAQGARRIIIRTVKETVIDDIILQKTSRKNRSQLDQLPIGELHPYLPRFDWRTQAIVPGVRDQGTCGSCWAHTATEALESNLMIQRANFATNNNDSFPDIFFVSQVELNVHSTLDCVTPRSCNGGRYETAFNYYFKQGVPVKEVRLNGLPLDQPAPAQPLPNKLAKDVALPKGHCQDKTNDRIKIVGWDYVNQRKPWRIPSNEAMKMALLEHGPLAVAINTMGLKEYGNQRLTDQSVEIASNADTGIAFKRENVSGGLLVCIPAKLVQKKFVQSLNGEFFNFNLPKGGDRRYQFMPGVASVFKQGTHRRTTKEDLDVREFYQLTTDVFADSGKSSKRATETFVLHFPASNAVKLERDRKTGKFALSLPENSNTKIRRNSRTGELTMVIPFRPPEDLTPVFKANADLPFNHYVLLVGWDDHKEAWIMQNSWGEDWGFNCHYQGGLDLQNGYAYVGYGTFGQFAAWVEAPLIEQSLADALKRIPARL